ncbi:MAG: hypothetical protein Q8Q06_02540, partial [bacterium]|nr:hypothetical protein [bacterium]
AEDVQETLAAENADANVSSTKNQESNLESPKIQELKKQVDDWIGIFRQDISSFKEMWGPQVREGAMNQTPEQKKHFDWVDSSIDRWEKSIQLLQEVKDKYLNEGKLEGPAPMLNLEEYIHRIINEKVYL